MISITNKLITIKDQESQNHAILVEETSLDNMKLNDVIITTGYLNENQILASAYLYIIPRVKPTSPINEATKSATASTKNKN